MYRDRNLDRRRFPPHRHVAHEAIGGSFLDGRLMPCRWFSAAADGLEPAVLNWWLLATNAIRVCVICDGGLMTTMQLSLLRFSLKETLKGWSECVVAEHHREG